VLVASRGARSGKRRPARWSDEDDNFLRANLGLLPEALDTPRRATPRLRVPAGSVGVAGRQTAVYPFASPGGWSLIGQTTTRLFDPTRIPILPSWGSLFSAMSIFAMILIREMTAP